MSLNCKVQYNEVNPYHRTFSWSCHSFTQHYLARLPRPFKDPWGSACSAPSSLLAWILTFDIPSRLIIGHAFATKFPILYCQQVALYLASMNTIHWIPRQWSVFMQTAFDDLIIRFQTNIVLLVTATRAYHAMTLSWACCTRIRRIQCAKGRQIAQQTSSKRLKLTDDVPCKHIFLVWWSSLVCRMQNSGNDEEAVMHLGVTVGNRFAHHVLNSQYVHIFLYCISTGKQSDAFTSKSSNKINDSIFKHFQYT